MKKLFVDCTPSDRTAFNSVLIAVLLTVAYQTFHTLFPPSLGFIVSLIIIFFCIRGLVIYYKNHSINVWSRWFLLLIIYFLFVGLLHGGPFTNNTIGLILSQDIRYVLFFLIGGIFALDDNMKVFHQMMKVLGVISIVFGFLSIFYQSTFTLQSIASREGAWSLSYYYWWCSSACVYYWAYYILFVRKDTRIGYGVMIVYIVLGVLFLKRAAVVDFLVILLFYVLFAKKSKGFLKPLLLIFIGALVLMAFKGSLVNNIYELMLGRFESARDEFDRTIETNNYFENANKLDLVFGNGIGHYYNLFDIRGKDETLNALHLGWANIIYKGGVPYALYMLIMYICIVIKIFNLHKDNYGKVCLGVAISSLISMFYAGSWTYTIAPFCISAPIFYILTHKTDDKSLLGT